MEVVHNTDTQKSSRKRTGAMKIRDAVSNISIEPVIALYMLPGVMNNLSVQNLSLEKACRVNLQLGENICDSLTSRNVSLLLKGHEIDVQQLVASTLAWKSFLLSLVPTTLLLFIGSWSDKHRRRKPFILLPIMGECVSCLGYITCTYFFYEFPMQVNSVFESLPALTGGWYTMFMASFSYLSDICRIEERTARIGVVHIVLESSITLGVALSGILFKTLGFYGVFSLCSVFYLSALAFGYFRIHEIGNKFSNTSEYGVTKPFLKDFFDLKGIKETFSTVFKSGNNGRRKKLCLMFSLATCISGPFYGELGVTYLFVRYRFHWNEVDYSVYSTYSAVVHVIGTSFSIALFSKYLKLDDSILGIISTSSRLVSCFISAFAPTTLIFYLAPTINFMGGMSQIAMRSIITKLVFPDELGKVNSVFGVCEALVPLLFGPLYGLLYGATIEIFPGTVFVIGSLLSVPAISIFSWMYMNHKQDQMEAKQNQVVKEELLN